ncbi:VOC family protein [Streptomyces sp. NPDC004629]|uniref:VOC family protein n=1 Tax=Streptomyces sp. NPDC004629 TaxID=3364705 RepID=UPI00367A7C94
MTATPKFAHIVLQTNRVAEMRDWYRTVLGADIVYENPGMCFLTFDEEHHRIALVGAPAEPWVERTPFTVGLQHSAFTFPTLEALLEKFEDLRAAGIEPRVPIQHGVTTSLYYRDPDGNTVELQIDNFARPEDATAYMTGVEYAADPVGPSFDPQKMVEALQSGASVEELTTRSWAAESGSPYSDPMARLFAPA